MAQFRHTARELLITYVKSDGNLLKFWALPATALEVVKNLENHYAKVAGELDKMSGYIRNSQTPVGMKLSVKSKIKRQWCRARVLSHSGPSDILVQLMDYGNEENISVTDARRLEDRLISVEPQAIECILADVVPPGTSEWPPEAIKFCESHLSYQTLSCYVVSSYLSIPVVRVAKGGESEPFVQRLINSGLALIKQEQPVAVPPAVSYKVNTMDPKTAHLVKVSHVESIRKFYVQLSVAEVELQRLMDAIQKYVAQESLALLNVPLVSAACLAESDHLYRRARILAVLQGKCQIFYVDYGYAETKEFQELRAIPQYFMTLPAQAICCSLANDDREEMRLVTKGYHLQCFVLGYDGDKCIVSLRRHGPDIIAPRRISPQMAVYSATYRKQKLNLRSSIEVTVSSITDITEFYCQLLCFKDQQEAIAFKLNSGYIFESLHINECIPGQAICVKFHNKIWYRAEILKVNHEQDIEVFFVDIGNYEKVSLANIRKVNSELLNFPCQAYKCCLYETGNILNGVPKEEVLCLFQELTLGKNLKAQVQAFTEDSGYIITLYEMDSNISVFQKMESKILTASTVPVSDVENLFVTSFTSPSLFFAQFEKLDSNLLSEMQEQINELYGSKRNLKYFPMVGNLVCAKYEEDNQFYRALVISFKDSQFEVFFIDYGNRCIVPLHDIHPITKEFIKFPAFGIECSLESYPPGTPVDKLCSLMLENSIQARMIAEKDKKWLVTLTDDFPNNVAILELLRQHENVVPRPIHGIGGFQENRTRKGSNYQPKVNERDEIQPRLDIKQSYKKEQVSRNQMPHESENIVKTKETKVFQNYDVIEIPPNAYRNVYVSHVVSPSEFYCQIEEDSPKLLVLMKDIEDMYTFLNDNDLKLSTFALNSPCCAVFQEDGVWYRGQIRKINSNSCDIYFVDYGNTDTVPSSKIKMLKNELLSLPPQAIRCKSFNIVPKTGSWSDADIEAFQAMTLDKSFVAQFVEQDDQGVYSVNLVSIGKLQEDVLNKEFVDLGHGQLADSSKILVLNSHAASSNLTYKSLDIKIGSTEPVKVTYGLNPGEIFCQLKCYNKEFETMMLNLQDYYNKVNEAEALVDRPHPGMICVAQFFLDSAWYRAEIKKVEKTTIVVFYVDYGNCETVDRKKIRCILQDFTLLPTQAVRCRIRGIKPPGRVWPCNENMGKYFEGNTECKFIEKDDDYYYIDLTCNMENVAQRLVKDRLAVFDEGISKSEQISVENNKTTIPYKSKAASTLPEREQAFVPGQLISVIVSYIESPSKFWCQSLDESDMLEKLMSDIDGVFSQAKSDPSTLTVGSYCIAKFSEDEAWYRAQIKSHVPGSGYEVFFIDYGNSETVSESEVATITSDFMKLPPLCFECQLLHAPADSNLDNNTAFQNLIDEAEEITAKIEESSKNVYVVTLLYDKDSEEVNINNVLFGSSSDATEPVSKDTHFLSPDVPLGLQDGYITVVNSPQDFYIQLSSCEDSLADLSSKLSDICEAMTDDKTTVQNPCVGLACCAKFSEDNNWYRAEILNLTDTTASVLFVDYGNVDEVPKTSLKILTEEYLQIPPYAIKCKLNGIVPVTEQWSEEAVTTFQDMVLDSPLAITFISKDVPATVNVAKDDKEVAQYLVDVELANVDTCTEAEEAYAEDHLTSPLEEQFSLSNDQSYPNRKLSASKLLVKISYVDTYNKFYVIPLELTTELDTITKTLELLYRPDADKPPVPIEPEDIKANMPCVAKCGDRTWCRAIITEVDGDNVYVTLVDYGNPELISIKNLRAINPELVEIPPVAVECSLFGVQAIEGNEKKITAQLDHYFVEETELMMEICESKPYKVKLNCNGDFAEMIAEGLDKFDSCAKNEQVTDNFISGSSIIVDEEPSKVKNIITTYSVSGLDEILGNVKYAEIENDLIILHVVPVDADLKLEVMQERLQTVYNESENKVIQVKEMDFCVAKYAEDESWYRAKVVACYDGKVKVQFVDYGNCDTVDMENICELLPEFVEACQFSVKFCLSGFQMFENKSEELQNKLDQYVYNEPLLLKLCKYKHDVPGICTAKVIFGDTDLAEMLIDDELLFQQYVLNSDLDNSFEATIEQNKSGILYVLPVKLKEDRDNFQTELEKYCNMCEMVPSINKWRLYAAKYNEHWFRSTVLSCSSEEANVKFVDFGHEATVKISDLVSLPVEMSHQPVFLQPCVVKEIKGILDESYEKILDKIPSDTAVFCELLETRSYPHAVKLSFTDPEFSFLTDSADEASNTYCESAEKKDAESTIKSESDNELEPQLNDESSLIYDSNANSQGQKINEELEPLNNKHSDKSDDFGFDDSVINSENLQPILNDLSMKEVEVSNEETKLEIQITDFAKDDDYVNKDTLRNEPHHDNFSENESFSNDTEVNQKIDENSDEFKLPTEQFESVPELDEYQGIERKDKILPSSNAEDSGYTFENSKELIEGNHVVLDDNGIPEYEESTNLSREPMQLMNNTINDISNAETSSTNEVPKHSDCETFFEGSTDNRHLSGSVKVIVSSIGISDDGSIILAVIPMQFQEQLSNFNRDLNLAYSSKDLSSSYNPESKFCAVFTDENEWRRAQVIGKEEKLTVSFIDYGVIDSVEISTAQDLDPKFASIPPFAVWCTLAAISCSSDKSSITKEYLENTIKSKEAVIAIIEDNEPYQVNLYVDGVDIVNELLLNDMVASKFGTANVEPGHYSAKMSHLTTELKHLELFVNLIPQWENFKSLQSSMQNAYTVKNEKIQVRKLQAYAVWHDGKWSRCTILSCDDEIILNLIDSGEKISYSSTLCPLLPEHCLHPPYAVPCEIPSFIHTGHKEAADMLNDIFGSEFLVYVERDVHTDSLVSRLEDSTIINRLKNMQETLSYLDLEESTSERDFDQSEPAQETINVSHSDTSERDFDQSEPAQETINVSRSDTSERDFDQSEPAQETINVSHSDASEQDFDQSDPAQETINVSYSDSNLKSDEMQEQGKECLQNEAETVTEVLGIPQADDITQKEELQSELPHVDSDSFHLEQEENKEVTSNDCLEKDESKDGSETDDINECDTTETSQAITDSFVFEKKKEKELRVNKTLEDNLIKEVLLENAHVDSELLACDAEQESITNCEQFQESFRKTELLETTQSSSPNKPEKEELIGYLKESFSTQPLQECSESID